jgi:hypothetical protein
MVSLKTVQHRSRVAQDPTQPNLRQLHLIHAELHDELRAAGFIIAAEQIGENITTRGVDLLGLPAGARLHLSRPVQFVRSFPRCKIYEPIPQGYLGATAVDEVTGLRNPCTQLDCLQPGLIAAMLDRDAQGKLIRKWLDPVLTPPPMGAFEKDQKMFLIKRLSNQSTVRYGSAFVCLLTNPVVVIVRDTQ